MVEQQKEKKERKSMVKAVKKAMTVKKNLIFFTKIERKPLSKKDKEIDERSENDSENHSSDEEESVFFLTKQEREELAKQRIRGETQKKKKRKVQKSRECDGKSEPENIEDDQEREELGKQRIRGESQKKRKVQKSRKCERESEAIDIEGEEVTDNENEGNKDDQPIIRKVEFDKMYKGPKYYFAGDAFTIVFTIAKYTS